MHKITFFPLSNADCFRIDLANGRKLLFDYAAMRDPDDNADRRIDLPTELRNDLEALDRDDYDVVVFTHLDDDHVRGSSEFFWLEHAKKYQGKNRIKIQEMWVPAAAIIEEGAEDEARILRAEARHRLREGRGIRVFSRPAMLERWFNDQGLNLAERGHLITDAGNSVPGFTPVVDEVEFFVHSPFAIRQDGKVVDRNADALVLHATFTRAGRETKGLFTSDIKYDVMADIVKVTRRKGNATRLEWDVMDIPHHCSYTALGPEKGEEQTEPVDEVKWLYEERGRRSGIIISPSWEIPSKDTEQPPHRQAAHYYKERARAITGEFKVTMEHPRVSNPRPLVIKIDGFGATIEKLMGTGAAAIVSRPAPRAG